MHYGHGTDNPDDEAVYLVLGALGIPFDCTDQELDRELDDADYARIESLITRRIEERIPVAYLIGRAWFAGVPFKVNSRVLVPRSPIAELVEDRFSPWLDEDRVRRILDIGTGSGCIAVSCALAFPGAMIDAVDLDTAALEVAAENARLHNVAKRVRCIRSDLFEALGDIAYDLIVSNPPYVPTTEYSKLPSEYRHEPGLGLEAGPDGLNVVRRILAGAAAHLEPDGVLVVEVGTARAALETAYPHLPFTWLEFERGGEGVFLLSREQLGGRANIAE